MRHGHTFSHPDSNATDTDRYARTHAVADSNATDSDAYAHAYCHPYFNTRADANIYARATSRPGP